MHSHLRWRESSDRTAQRVGQVAATGAAKVAVGRVIIGRIIGRSGAAELGMFVRLDYNDGKKKTVLLKEPKSALE